MEESTSGKEVGRGESFSRTALNIEESPPPDEALWRWSRDIPTVSSDLPPVADLYGPTDLRASELSEKDDAMEMVVSPSVGTDVGELGSSAGVSERQDDQAHGREQKILQEASPAVKQTQQQGHVLNHGRAENSPRQSAGRSYSQDALRMENGDESLRMRRERGLGRKSKVDQMLGEGAEYARATMEMDKASLYGTFERRMGPVPPPRKNRAHPSANSSPISRAGKMASLRSNTVANAEMLVLPTEKALNLSSPQHVYRRSASIDSLPSIHPSLSESINTLNGERRPLLTNSLPPFPVPSRLATQDPPSRTSFSTPPVHDSSETSNLTSAERTMLLRRARKLEYLLGTSLPESQISQHVVNPLSAVRVYDTKVDNAWPDHGLEWRKHDVPVWEREDCLVERASVTDENVGLDMDDASTKGKKLAQKALAALNLSIKPEGEDLKVYVSRQMRVTETVSKILTEHISVNRDELADEVASLESTSANTTTSDGNWPDTTKEDENAKRIKRQQLAKLHRLLGVPVPPELLINRRAFNDKLFSRHASNPAVSSASCCPERDSSIKFEGTTTGKWPKIKPFNRKKKEQVDENGLGGNMDLAFDSAASFMDMGPGKRLTKEERTMVRKRTAKLEQVLGKKPPLHYVSAITSRNNLFTPDDDHLSIYSSSSLEDLLYLVDHDQIKVAQAMEGLRPGHDNGNHSRSNPHDSSRRTRSFSLTSQSSVCRENQYDFLNLTPEEFVSQQGSPLPMTTDPQSHAARRRRASKLSQFFGESVDLSKSPAELASMAPRRSISTSKSSLGSGTGKWKARRETMDAVLLDMWKRVQAEKGQDGVERLGDMIGTLKERRKAKPWETV
ncbi:hypothetical protein L204_102101 [Cryptococcus depauperatus]|nr:hypothetical protein L204_04587 [Cryptococcus depauperatus CBS 7855]